MKRIVALIVFCVISKASADLTNGLVAYYPFHGNANDASGNGNNGTNYGATFTQNQFGSANAAIHFNQSYVLTGLFPPLGPAPRTFTGWFEAPTSSSQMTLMAYGGSSTYAGDRFELGLLPSGQFTLDCSYGGVWTPASYTDSNWHSFAVVVPQNAALSNVLIYIDGIAATNLVSNAPGNLLNTAAVYPLEFGELFIGGSRPLTGSLSDVRIYNRALSSAEVQSISNTPCIPHAATGTATVVNGFVVGIALADFGCGYSTAPSVQIVGGGGSGASAYAQVSNGSVYNIVVTDAGSGYTNAPIVRIGSPPFVPMLTIGVSAVKVVEHVVLGKNYALESSFDLSNWVQVGTNFTADSEYITNVFDVDVTGRFFRILQLP